MPFKCSLTSAGVQSLDECTWLPGIPPRSDILSSWGCRWEVLGGLGKASLFSRMDTIVLGNIQSSKGHQRLLVGIWNLFLCLSKSNEKQLLSWYHSHPRLTNLVPPFPPARALRLLLTQARQILPRKHYLVMNNAVSPLTTSPLFWLASLEGPSFHPAPPEVLNLRTGPCSRKTSGAGPKTLC